MPRATTGNISGTYTFDNTYTQENNGSDSTFAPSNFALSYAAFLMGINTTTSVSSNSFILLPVSVLRVLCGRYVARDSQIDHHTRPSL